MGIYDSHAIHYDAIWQVRGRDVRADVDLVLEIAERHGVAPRSILDVACGTGMHVVEFASRVDDVVGVDLSDEMLEVARGRGATVRREPADFRTLALGRRFDLVTCLFSSIGHVSNEVELRRAIGCMAAHVAPSGLLVVETWLTPDMVDPNRTKDAVVARTEEGFVARLSSAQVTDDALLVEFGWAVADAEGCHTDVEQHRMPLFTPDQYTAAVVDAGLRPTWMETSPGLAGRPLLVGAHP